MSNPMGLNIPTPNVTTGPLYATQVSDDLSVIASHQHTGASNNDGNQIPSAGLNINADLSFNSNNAITLRSTRFANQSSVLAGVGDIGCVYEKSGDLWYNNSAGTPIQITSGSTINFTNSVNYASLAVTSNHTIGPSDVVTILECDPTSGAITITLPAIANVPAGRFYIVKDKTGTSQTHNITVNPAGLNTIDQVASYTIADNHLAVGFVSDGIGNWSVLAWNRKIYFSGETVKLNAGSTLNVAGSLTTSGAITLNGGSFISSINLEFDGAVTDPSIFQDDIGTNGATGKTLYLHAQNATGTTSTGGTLVLKGGTGTSADGVVTIVNGNTTNTQFLSGSQLLSVNSLNWNVTNTPTISQLQRTSDAAVHDFTIAPQAPYASSTGTNRNAPNFIVSLPPPANVAAARGSMQIQDNSVILLTITGDSSANTILDANGSGGQSLTFKANGTQRLQLTTTGIGFYGTAAIAKPTVTGAKGGNAALGSLMTALSNLGLVTDSTSA